MIAGVPRSTSKTTTAAIHEAALPLFVGNGFAATTMDAIAGAAGVSRRTLYRYFADKEEVFFEYHERETAVLDGLLASGSSDALLAILRQFAGELTADREVLALRAQVVSRTPHLLGRALQRRSDWERRVAEWLAAGAGIEAPTLEMRVASAAAMGALYVAVREVVFNGRPLHRTVDRALELVADVVDAVVRA